MIYFWNFCMFYIFVYFEPYRASLNCLPFRGMLQRRKGENFDFGGRFFFDFGGRKISLTYVPIIIIIIIGTVHLPTVHWQLTIRLNIKEN